MMKIKKKFDEFDVDGSGEIDPEEFKAMIVFFLKVKDISDLPAARVQRFWAEIDVDQSGQVSFAEFVGWLAKTFPEYLAGGSSGKKTFAAKGLYSNQSTRIANGVQEAAANKKVVRGSKEKDSKEMPSK